MSATEIASPWQPLHALAPPPTARERDWLSDDNSLTRRLTELSGNRFSVVLLAQGWQVLRDDECAALGVAGGCTGWVREVYLCGADAPWVFARSVASRNALEGADLALDRLGRRSLGELLFSDRAFARGAFQACHYPAAWLPEPTRQEGLWARRSCFRHGALQVLVAEAFLPAFWVDGVDRRHPCER